MCARRTSRGPSLVRPGALVRRPLRRPVRGWADSIFGSLPALHVSATYDLDHAPAFEPEEQARNVGPVHSAGCGDPSLARPSLAGGTDVTPQDAEDPKLGMGHPSEVIVDCVRCRHAVAAPSLTWGHAGSRLTVRRRRRNPNSPECGSPGSLERHAPDPSGSGPRGSARSNLRGTASPSRCFTQRYSTEIRVRGGPSVSGLIPTKDSVAA